MAKKTNKTSHVMDLLTNGASPETEEPVSETASGQEKKSDVQSHSVTPAKVTVVDEGSRNDRLSQEILGKLTEELEEETKKEQAPEETAVSEQSLPEAESVTEEPEDILQTLSSAEGETAESAGPDTPESVSELVEAQLSEPEPPSQKPDTVSGKEPHPIIPESEMNNRIQHKEYRFVNVMEQLIMRQDLDAVLKQHNVCNCPRCMSDVCALALTGLPAKYVVTSKDSISPLLSYYENKYKIPVLTELMKACNKVRQNPRHKTS